MLHYLNHLVYHELLIFDQLRPKSLSHYAKQMDIGQGLQVFVLLELNYVLEELMEV